MRQAGERVVAAKKEGVAWVDGWMKVLEDEAKERKI